MRNRVIAAIVVLLLAAVPSACTPASAGGVANLVAAVAGGSKGSGTEAGGDAPGRDEAGSGTGADAAPGAEDPQRDAQPDADGDADPQSEPQRDETQSPDVKAHLGFDPEGGWPDTVDEQYYYLLNIVQSDPLPYDHIVVPLFQFTFIGDISSKLYRNNGGMSTVTPTNPDYPAIKDQSFDDMAMIIANDAYTYHDEYAEYWNGQPNNLDDSLRPMFGRIRDAYNTPGTGSAKFIYDDPRTGATVGVLVKPLRSITFVSDGTHHPAEGE